MNPLKYYSASSVPNTIEKHVPAPYIRKSFNVSSLDDKYELLISVVGIYELSINGVIINKGYLIPYRTNPNHFVYFDIYNLNKYLKIGENVIGVMLGNGFSNSIYSGWDFDKLSWAHAPKIALEVKQNDKVIFDASSFKQHDSEVLFDDFHAGEHIDANKNIKGWNEPGFNDSGWKEMLEAPSPKGKLRKHPNFYPTVLEEIKPVKVIKGKDCYIYDFGRSLTGIYKIHIKGQKNKVIKLFMNDAMNEDKTVFKDNMFRIASIPQEYKHFDWLTLSGGNDYFTNRFNYKSGRFIELANLSDEEAKTVKISFLNISSLSKPKNYFRCDNEVINKLQECTVNSDITNFFYFPTDCPQREKNGWTGDACLSAEQMLINFDCYKQLKEWYRNIVKAQNRKGTIPGIVPTDTWGFAWGNGPGWDTVLFELPYRLYIYSGDIDILKLAHKPILRYLKYMRTKQNDRGLFKYGLGDWLPVKTHTPIEIVDSILCKYHCDLANKIFNILGDKENANKAIAFSDEIKKNFNHYYPVSTDVRYYNQTWAAMALYYDMYDGLEKEKAIECLYRSINISNGYMDFGVMGNRAMWRVLADLGQVDLALHMMTRTDGVSFSNWIRQRATTLFEEFVMFDGTMENLTKDFLEGGTSFNHHFWGDISAFFYRDLAGLRINEPNVITFAPRLSKDINYIEAKMNGVKVTINKIDSRYDVDLYIPKGIKTSLNLLNNYQCSIKEINSGRNQFSIYVKD